MRLFTISEKIQEGLPLVLKPGDPRVVIAASDSKSLVLPLGSSLKRLLDKEDLELDFRLVRGDIQESLGGLTLVKEQKGGSDKALVLLATSAGIGGHVLYDTPKGCTQPAVITALPIKGGSGERWEQRLLIMKPGDALRVNRTGGLEGGPPVISALWDGKFLREPVHQAARRQGPRQDLPQ